MGGHVSEVIMTFHVHNNNYSRYVYKRCKWLGSQKLSHLLSMIFLILWHGIWLGYFICFSFEFFMIIAERQVKLIITYQYLYLYSS